MNKLIILLLMVFFHIADDYYLQGKLAELKQKKFWENYGRFYANDYIIALLEHAFSWTLMIFLPIIVAYLFFGLYINTPTFIVIFLFNWAIHAIVDHAKANLLAINLTEDQLIHIGQIVLTWIILVA